jgi:hydrophobe/amphiphile efflux-3 (HAE3) family protein
VPPLLFAAALAVAFGAVLAAVAWRPAVVVAYPRAVLAAVAAVTLLAAVPLVRLDPPGLALAIDPSTEPLLPAGDPARESYARAVRDFGDDEVYVVAMETEEGVFRRESLERLRRLTDAIAQLPEVRRVNSLTEVVAFRWVPEEDWIDVGRLIEAIPSDPAALAALARDTLEHPLYRRSLVSADGRTAAVNVSFQKMSDREFIGSGLDARIGALLAAETAPGVRFHVAGRPHVKDAVYHWMLRDVRLLIPASLAVFAAILFLVFGTRRGVVLPLSMTVVATIWTFGAIAFLGRSLSVLTVLLPPTLITMGTVYGIHALSRYEEEARRAERPAQAALRCLEHLRVPVLVSGLTTIAGWLALMNTTVPAVLEIGAFASLGIASLTLLTLTAFHSVLALAPLRAAGAGAHGPADWLAGHIDAVLAWIAELTRRRTTAILVGFGLATALAAVLIPRITIDTDYLSFFDAEAPVRRDFEAVDRLLAGAVPLYVTLQGAGAGAFRDPEALRAIERLQRAAEAIPGVSRTHSMADVVRVLNRALSRDDPAEERIPDTGPAVAELVFMAPKEDLGRYTNADHSRANVVVRTGAVGTAEVRAVDAALRRAVAAAALPAGVGAEVTGNAILLAHSADGIARGQPQSVAIATLTCLVIATLGIRSLRIGLVAMSPNVIPVLLFFGMLGAGVAPLSLPTSLIGCVALGITVDDTVHYLVRYRDERAAGLDPVRANQVCARHVGRANLVTSFTLVAGFLVVALSSFATLRQFGLLSAATMAMCLAGDVLLLPAILKRFRV